MCVIAICRDRVLTAQEVSAASAGNPDGIGIAWFAKDCIVYRKGISEDHLNKLLDRGLPLPLVIHFRFATSGAITPEMCHPYACSPTVLSGSGRTRKKLLFHNGVIPSWEAIMMGMMPEIIRRYKRVPDGEWNDSRVAALAVGMYGDQVLQFLDGKYAIMSSDGTVETYGSFREKDGVLLSAPLGCIVPGKYNGVASAGQKLLFSGYDYDYDDKQAPLYEGGSIYDSLAADTERGV